MPRRACAGSGFKAGSFEGIKHEAERREPHTGPDAR